MQNTSEKDLILLIKKGDQKAFREIAAIYYEKLYLFMWRRTGDDQIAYDLLQDLFLNVWKRREELDPGKSFKAYLYSAANNLAINHFKSLKIRGKYFSENAEEIEHKSSQNPAEFHEYLEDVLYGLPQEQKSVFILNKFDGFKYSEIAEMLDISVKTVESRMAKILKTLREKLGPLLIVLAAFLTGFK